jgi:hypothetical protein
MKKKQSKKVESQSTTKQLIIGKQNKQELNKQQKAFNRLVKRLENLRKDFDKKSDKLRKHLEFYGQHIHPLEQDLVGHRKEAVKLLFKSYKDEKAIPKKDKEVLIEIISSQLSDIFHYSSEKPDEEIMGIFEAVEGMSFDKAADEDFQNMKNEMSEAFEEMGFDVDLDGFHSNMSEEEMARKMFEMFGNLQEQAEAKEAARPKRKKTKKQLEKEERERQIEEAKSKNIATIYKQLARIFHPDLERDPVLKSEKEDLMKQLTNAYEKNDLHTLLRLELEWIHKEEDNLEQLSDEKLSIYNEVLKEQVRELEEEIFMIGQHPRYAPLQRFSMMPLGMGYIDLEREKRKLESTIKEIKKSVDELKGKNAVRELKTIISSFKQAMARRNFFDLDLAELFR